MKRVLISVFSVTLLIGFTAMAMAWGGKYRGDCPGYGPGYGPGPAPRLMDTNKDNKISKAEWDKFHNERFKELDTNKDGVIEEKEFRDRRPMRNNRRGK